MELKNVIEIKQTNNDSYTAYFSKISAEKLISLSETLRISETRDGVQRFLDQARVDNIAKYCEKEDAIFPTPIILSLNSDFISKKLDDNNSMFIDENLADLLGKPFSIIDGQHRVAGINKYFTNNINNKDIELPIIFYLDADQSTSANIFVTINSNQRAVDKSIIYELFGIMYENKKIYTVQSFANKVVKLLNGIDESPFKDSIKILGRKMQHKEFISQGTIAKKIIERISKERTIIDDNISIEKNNDIYHEEGKIFRIYFARNRPEIIAKIMINFFFAFSNTFEEFWIKEEYITKKAIGFSGLMKLLDIIYVNEEDLSVINLTNIFEKMKQEYYNEIQRALRKKGSSESVATEIGETLKQIYLKLS
ncbi:DGQHR domain-containing protein [Streptococcus zalophi]|uniref:DGQHR domain-containing protein n=1 Tax=Streptococcus zalophi TaxID=640031 RepID=UPI00215CFE1A|nr:DGQHR domain-containing protein [Streptococcus zalophi]MCR8967518.1 DGQHR domain-containing protein [Streptococcus zalophi]